MQNETEILKLKKLSNEELFENTKHLVREETKATLTVLYSLREIERRRAFAEKHFPSLFEFCVGFLGYKKGAAYRRILAMRALKEIPEIEEKIQNGSLSLMTLSQAQGYFTQRKREEKPLTFDEKKEILQTLENKSSRQTEQFFLELSPKIPTKESMKPLSPDTFELRLTLPIRVKEKLEKLKLEMGAEKAGIETLEAIEKALDIAIRSYEKKLENYEKKTETSNKNTNEAPRTFPTLEPNSNSGSRSRTISVHMKRQIWKRDIGQCTHVDPRTSQRCDSKFRLEMDHVEPKALGGSNDNENLRLVCKSHNQWAAIQKLGFERMAPHIGES